VLSCGDKHLPGERIGIPNKALAVLGLIKPSLLPLLVVAILCLLPLYAQDPSSSEDIPIQRCDGLPFIKVLINHSEMFFLLDTASTTILNLESFPSGPSRRVPVTTWSGTTTTNGREISLPEVEVGSYRLRDLKLPAVDLSMIEKACGGRIDGILGFDLLDRLGITINWKRQVASVDMSPLDLRARFAAMEEAMRPCQEAFHLGRRDILKNCFDPAIVLYTPNGEFRGRQQVMDYLEQHYLRFAPRVRFEPTLRDMQSLGDALWYSYDYTIESPNEHAVGHGTAMCKRTGGRWRILNMNNSVFLQEASRIEGRTTSAVPPTSRSHMSSTQP